MRILFVLLALALVPAAQAQQPGAPFSFVAFGDMPYCLPTAPQNCPAEHGRVANLMRVMNDLRPAFSIFVGDTMGGSELCTDANLLRAFNWMTLATHPLVYTPGDNEWTDCWQDRAGRFDQLERLALLRARYFRDAFSMGRVPMPLTRQADIQPAHATFVENATWMRNTVLFATVHIIGSNNNLPTEPGETPVSRPPASAVGEWQARDAANVAWLDHVFAEARRLDAPAMVLAMQSDLFYVDRCGRGQRSGFVNIRPAIIRGAQAFGRPVLLVHGDSHFWLHDRPLPEAPNLTRVMVPGDQDTRAVRVTVDPAAADPWGFAVFGPSDRAAAPGC